MGQSEDYANGCLLGYDYVKNCCRLIAVDLSRQEELDANSKGIQKIEFIWAIKKTDVNYNLTDAVNDQSMSILKFLEKTKETRLTFFQGSVKVGKFSRSES